MLCEMRRVHATDSACMQALPVPVRLFVYSNIHEPFNDANPNLAAPHGPKSVAFREFIAAAP